MLFLTAVDIFVIWNLPTVVVYFLIFRLCCVELWHLVINTKMPQLHVAQFEPVDKFLLCRKHIDVEKNNQAI